MAHTDDSPTHNRASASTPDADIRVHSFQLNELRKSIDRLVTSVDALRGELTGQKERIYIIEKDAEAAAEAHTVLRQRVTDCEKAHGGHASKDSLKGALRTQRLPNWLKHVLTAIATALATIAAGYASAPSSPRHAVPTAAHPTPVIPSE